MLEFLAPGFLYSIVKDGIAAVRHRRRRLSPAEVVARRNKWKPLFEAYISENHRKRLREDVIVRDMKRIDSYPEVEEGKGISAWFRVGLVGTYHRGILLGLRWDTLTRTSDGKHWRTTNYSAGEQGDVKVVLVGRVPYEYIDDVDWDGDEYYGYPHIYCSFDHKNEPYEHVGYCTETVPPTGLPFYTEVVTYNQVRRTAR